MKPTVINAANANSSANGGHANADAAANAMNVPINHQYAPHYANAESNTTSQYGSPNSHARQQQQPQQQHQIPAHFQQGFGFDPDMDMDMDMFPRGRLGRMHHDPFSGFGAPHFGFGSLGRRRMQPSANDGMDDDGDFFNRLPSEFRQYIPEGFGHRRAGSNTMPQYAQEQTPQQQQQHYPYHAPNYVPGSTPPNNYANMPPQSPSKKLCDAAIQTEDPMQASDQVDHAVPMKQPDHLNQHGLRNTVDMGVKATPEGEQHGPRAHSAPPNEQQMPQQNNGATGRRATPPQQQQTQFGTQTSPQPANSNVYHKAYYAPQQQPHPQQKQQTPPPSTQQQPQTPGGTYIRTIPIFVEGRSEPIINAHKEIPNQNAPPTSAPHASANAKANAGYHHPQQQQQFYTQPQHQQQQHPQSQQQPHHPQRPSPLNTQQQPPPQQFAGGPPPQTPHTLDSINKIQDIQRDVLELMAQVENFKGKRQDKEYAYLDEMLTRNLLKLDTIDTNGKDSIRLARKEAIKCIQASINVLEAKAEENAKTAQGGEDAAAQPTTNDDGNTSNEVATNPDSKDQENLPNTEAAADAPKPQEPIPLPPPSEAAADTTKPATKEASPPAVGDATNEISTNQSTTTEEK